MSHKSATVLLVGMNLVAIGAAAEQHDAMTRVRSEYPPIARLVTQATEGSATFRREVEAIALTNGLVYVYEGRCGHGVPACLIHTVELAGPYRLLKVKLDPCRSEMETMVALGHELHHAIEALRDPGVTNNARMVSFFQRLAPTDSHSFETPAAVNAGYDIFDELIANAKPPRRRPPRNIAANNLP